MVVRVRLADLVRNLCNCYNVSSQEARDAVDQAVAAGKLAYDVIDGECFYREVLPQWRPCDEVRDTPQITGCDANLDKRRWLKKLALFLGCDRIDYLDRGMGEDYVLYRKDRRVTLHVHGNRHDGGFLGMPDFHDDKDVPHGQ